MIDTSFGLLFYLKKGKKSADNEQPIYLRITVNGISKEISIQRTCSGAKWNGVTDRATGLKDEIRALNSYLDSIQSKVFAAKHRLIESGMQITAEAIKNILQGREGKEEKGHMLMEVFQQHNNQILALAGIEYAKGTMTKFKTVFNHTHAFLKWKYQVEDIDIRKPDYDFHFTT